MDKSTLLRYKGYTKTRSLFKTGALPEIDSIELTSEYEVISDEFEFKNQRLGKLVEEFVFYQLQQQSSVNWIVGNLQIQKDQRTIGELDALYNLNDQAIHLEIVYKFYLYDTLKSYDEPLSYWIGPNRKDTLQYKLDKLRNKQFPLLYRAETRQQLANYKVDIDLVLQKICFKAQLFLPYRNSKINITPLNDSCINGFYISFMEMSFFEDLKFYMPKKLDWLIIPHNAVEWTDYTSAKIEIEEQIEAKRSPLVWLKYNDTKFEKCFITFW